MKNFAALPRRAQRTTCSSKPLRGICITHVRCAAPPPAAAEAEEARQQRRQQHPRQEAARICIVPRDVKRSRSSLARTGRSERIGALERDAEKGGHGGHGSHWQRHELGHFLKGRDEERGNDEARASVVTTFPRACTTPAGDAFPCHRPARNAVSATCPMPRQLPVQSPHDLLFRRPTRPRSPFT